MLKIVLVTIVSLMIQSCSLPRVYSGGENHGWVVDSVTRDPVQGVVVVELWRLWAGPIETRHVGNLLIRETVTDEQGYYQFDAWPTRITMTGRLETVAPSLIFIKEGYAYKRIGNDSWHRDKNGETSQWAGQQIEFKKLGESEKLRKSSIELYASVLNLGVDASSALHCTWTRIPKYTMMLNKIWDRYILSSGAALPFKDHLKYTSCGDVDVLLREPE